ncbi:MAG: polysaccharide deacetylase family protein [Paludibacteraceae bacterium]|nr:polysaccharide deacetylase family protein [Paludibacteraceae bacterium]
MILLSFDIEEFDLPKEHGVDISMEESMRVSKEGTKIILDTLRERGAKATFFCTTNFAENAPEIIRQIVADGHELASHGCDHWQPSDDDAARSKPILEEIGGVAVHGYRQPRMANVSYETLSQAGYSYDSSLHPTCIPGRYNHWNLPRKPHKQGDLLEIPMSVTPWLRIPLFWLAFHNYPWWIYKTLCKRTHNHDGLFVIYFHPWEFVELAEHPEWKVPGIIKRGSGKNMAKRLNAFISLFGSEAFQTFSHWKGYVSDK